MANTAPRSFSPAFRTVSVLYCAQPTDVRHRWPRYFRFEITASGRASTAFGIRPERAIARRVVHARDRTVFGTGTMRKRVVLIYKRVNNTRLTTTCCRGGKICRADFRRLGAEDAIACTTDVGRRIVGVDQFSTVGTKAVGPRIMLGTVYGASFFPHSNPQAYKYFGTRLSSRSRTTGTGTTTNA